MRHFGLLFKDIGTICFVLSDYHMPNGSGTELLFKMKFAPQTAYTPMIFLTSEASPDKMKDVADADLSCRIKKPYHADFFPCHTIKGAASMWGGWKNWCITLTQKKAPRYNRKSQYMNTDKLLLPDTRIKLRLRKTEVTSIGVIVDVAKEVVKIEDQAIQKPDDIKGFKTSSPITGIINDHGDITMIMGIHRVFSVNEPGQVHESFN